MRRCRLGVLAMASCVALVWALAAVSALPALPVADMPHVYPDSNGVTQVNVSVRVHRVRIPLALSHHDEPLFFEYTGRFFELEEGEGRTGDNHARNAVLLPGPVIHVVPGGKLVVNITNRLGAERVVASPTHMYSFHGPNHTNLHFHGVHGDPHVDDPFVIVAPGQSHVYKLRIPREHIPGLHWYHTHYHGSVYFQVMAGLFGALSVDRGSLMAAPSHPMFAWDAHILLIHLYRLGKSTLCDGRTMQEMDRAIGTHVPTRPVLVDGRGRHADPPHDLFLVNGRHRPSVPVVLSQPTMLRLVYAGGSCFANVSLPTTCDFHVVAYDGVPLRRTERVKHHWLYLTTATRIEVVALCHASGEFALHATHDKKAVLMYLSVRPDKTRKPAKVKFPLLLPKYNADYLSLNGPRTMHRDISLSQLDIIHVKPRPYYILGQGTNCSTLRSNETCTYEHFMGRVGENTSQLGGYHGFTVPLYTVVTAALYGDPTDAMPHPFHFHVNHFKVLSFTPRPHGLHANQSLAMYGVAPGQYRDTVPVLDGVTLVQWQAATYTGEIVYHCHNLVHEDLGMMLSYLVYSDTTGPPGNVTNSAAHRGDDENEEHSGAIARTARGGRRHTRLYLLLTLVFGIACVLWFVPRCLRHIPVAADGDGTSSRLAALLRRYPQYGTNRAANNTPPHAP